MKINDLELFLVAVGQTDSAAVSHSLLVRITTTLGVEGWGESGLGWRAGEIVARREALLAVLEGRSIYDIEELHAMEALGSPSLRSAIEMAVWDALGRTLRQPLCNLLGGYYRRRVPVSVRLVGRKAGQTTQIARELAEQGFHTQTVAASGRPDEDLRTLASIREMVGDRIELRFDGMGRYDLETARDLATGMEGYGVQFLLDPLNTLELHRVASLARQTSVPLAVWRAIRSPADALIAMRCNAAPFLLVDLDQVGGIVPARACAAIASAAGVVPILASRPSVGIATAALLHVAAARAAFSTSNELGSRQLRDTVLTDSLEITDGMITVPQAYGLGITVDRAKVEKYQAG
jgi:L-alanine-DL-glutamate epimerase-like enolase superfamily enzyme